MASIRRIGVLTGGGDAPGLNAVIRAVVKAGSNNNCEVVGLEDSFDGLIEPNRSRVLGPKDVTGILRPVGDVDGMADAAIQLLHDRARWEDMSAAAAADARARFSRDQVVAQYEALYRDALR